MMELVFDVRVTTGDSYFMLDADPDPSTDSEASSTDGMLDLETFQLSRCHGQPSWQLLNSRTVIYITLV